MNDALAGAHWMSGFAWGALIVCIIWLLTKMDFE
jgi:hypothetical protein